MVPTRNAAATIDRCLASVQAVDLAVEILVVDNGSDDDTVRRAEDAGARVLHGGPERSAQRNVGLAAAQADAVVFLDADQLVTRGVLEDVCARLAADADALILTEQSIGAGYWAKVRALERRSYAGDDAVEAARAFRTDLVRSIGGFDEDLSAFEDWDLTERARAAGLRIDRTEGIVLHDEGRLALRTALRKKAYYGGWERRYRAKHPELAARQLSPWRRGWSLLRAMPGAAMRRPHVAAGVFVLKTLELASAKSAAWR